MADTTLDDLRAQLEELRAQAEVAQARAILVANQHVGFLVGCVSQWIRVYEQNLGRCPNSADADHSVLLQRLFRGKPCLPHPPPVRFSCPDYELAEGKVTEIDSIHETGVTDEHDYNVVIDGHRAWRWEQFGGLLQYRDGTLYRVFQQEDKTYLQKVPAHDQASGV